MKRYLCPLWMLFFVGCGNNSNPNVSNEVYSPSNERTIPPQHSLLKPQPVRGNIYDRNGICLVENKPNYVLWTIHEKYGNPAGLDTITFSQDPNLALTQLLKYLDTAEMVSRTPVVLAKHITAEQKHKLEQAEVEGFYFSPMPVRTYPANCATHLVGFLEKDPTDKNELCQTGIAGLERAYNSVLIGQGSNDRDLHCTIDARMQQLGKKLLNRKTGAAVAIDPTTWEILMMVSAPTYDPDKLMGREHDKYKMELLEDRRLPLIDRTHLARYLLPDELQAPRLFSYSTDSLLANAINTCKIEAFEKISKIAIYSSDTKYASPLGMAQLMTVLVNHGVCQTPILVRNDPNANRKTCNVKLDNTRIEKLIRTHLTKTGWRVALINNKSQSIAVGAAPKDKPRIVIAVALEENTDEAERIAEELEAYYLSL